MYRIVDSKRVVPNIHLLEIEAPAVAGQARPGQFVIVRVDHEGERIPLSVADWDRGSGTVTVVVKNIGHTTDKLSSLVRGGSIPTVVGPLGNPTEIDAYGTVLCLGGCYGIGSIFPIARELKEKGNRVLTVIEARSSYLLYWEDRLRAVSDKIFYITRDGSKGERGHMNRLPEIINSEMPIDRIIINGCTFLSKRGSDASRPMGIKTVVNLNPIMIDGTGMCGVCRVSIGASTKFACVDGPDFDGHEVNWSELLQRRKTYINEEVVPFRSSRCERRTAKN